MLDTLVLNIPLRPEYFTKNGNLHSIVGDIADYQVKAVPMSFSRDITGRTTVGDLRHPFESIPSSLSSMAMKFYATNVANTEPYVALNASVKFIQGHNVYGNSTVENLGKEMIASLARHYPHLFVCLDIPKINISRIDSTYSAKLESESLMQPCLRYLSKVSNGHRKVDTRRDFYNTVYFGGKTSRNGGAKIYNKGQEVRDYIADLKKKSVTNFRASKQLEIYTAELISYSENLLRLESTTKKRKLETLGIPDNFWSFIEYEKSNPNVLKNLWLSWFEPILGTLSGTVVRKVDDHHVLELLKEKLFTYKGVKLTKKRKFTYVLPPRPDHLHLPLPEHSSHIKRHYCVKAVPVKSFTKANNAYNFYQLLRLNGYYVVKERYNRRSFDINVKTLVDAGIVKSDLQNLGNIDDDVYDIASLINVDFNDQSPVGFNSPVSKYININCDTIYELLPSNSFDDIDTSVLSVDDINSELFELTSERDDSYLDTYYSHFYENEIDYSPIDYAGDDSMTAGQLRKIIPKK